MLKLALLFIIQIKYLMVLCAVNKAIIQVKWLPYRLSVIFSLKIIQIKYFGMFIKGNL